MSDEIKWWSYTPFIAEMMDDHMNAAPPGDYVLASDYDTFRAERDALQSRVRALVEDWRSEARDEAEGQGPSWVGSEYAFRRCADELAAALGLKEA